MALPVLQSKTSYLHTLAESSTQTFEQTKRDKNTESWKLKIKPGEKVKEIPILTTKISPGMIAVQQELRTSPDKSQRTEVSKK